jgi:hypothetical protein
VLRNAPAAAQSGGRTLAQASGIFGRRLTFLRDLKNFLTTGSRVSGEEMSDEGLRDADLDASAAAKAQEVALEGSHTAGPGYPPGYVKDYDEGRPHH